MTKYSGTTEVKNMTTFKNKTLAVSKLICATTFVALGLTTMYSQPVRAQDSKNVDAKKSDDVPIRGIVRAWAKANISTDLVARVVKVSFKEGQSFRKDDLLVQFDCRHKVAELRSAEARRREVKVALKSAVFLAKRRAGSRNDVEISRARVVRASADADAIRYRLKSCEIYAPYAGRISSMDIQVHEISSTTKPLLSIVALRSPQIELVVPSTWLRWLSRGTQFKFSIDETGRSYNAKIKRMGATVIAVNQTIKVFASFNAPTNEILPGMSGTAKFARMGE